MHQAKVKKMAMEDFKIGVDAHDSEKPKIIRRVSIQIIDGKVLANYSVADEVNYKSYDKIHADLKEFTQYAEKFLTL